MKLPAYRKNVLSLLAVAVMCTAAEDSTHALEDMTVQSSLVKTEALTRSDEMGKIEISSEEIMKLPTVGEADIARALKLVPGVSVGNENSAQLIVQGGAPEQNLTLIDGIPIYSVDHFFGFFSPFNANAIEKVSIYKNYFPGEYGSRISSVQAYTGTVADQDAYTASVRLGLLSGSFNVGVPMGDRLSLFVAGRRSFTDFLQSPLYDKIFSQFDQASEMENEFTTGEINRTPVFNYGDLNAKLRYQHDKDTAEVSFYWSRDDLAVDSKVSTELEQVNVNGGVTIDDPATPIFYADVHKHRMIENSAIWGNLGSAGRWSRRWNDLLSTQARAGFTSYYLESSEQQGTLTQYEGLPMQDDKPVYDSITNVEEKILKRENDNRVEELFGELSTELWFSESNQLKVGMQGQLYSTHYIQTEKFQSYSYLNPYSKGILYYPPIIIDDTVKVTDTDVSQGVGSAWIQDNINLGDKFFGALAARVSYYQGTGKAYFSPRISLAYDPVPVLRLKAGGGRYYQFITRAEMEDNYLEGERYFWILAGDKSAPVSSSDQISAGFSLTPWGFVFDVEAYFKRQNDIALYKRSPSPEQSSFLVGDGTSRGIDFMLQKSVGIYSGWIAYTLSEAVVQYTKEINGGDPFYSPYDRPHEVKFVNTVEKGGFNASATWVYATGTPHSVPLGHDSLEVFNRYYFDVKRSVWSAKNSHRLPDYHRLDISMSYKFTPSDWFDFTLGGSVFNLYNRKNIRGYDYKYVVSDNGYVGEDDKIVRLESRYMGITPSLFVAFDFKKWRN